jgi:hypothetical protein
MARALTAGELVSLRADGQNTVLRVGYVPIDYVFKARVNGAPSSNDSVIQVNYNTVTLGAFGDIVPGQTIFIGTTEGAYDKGMCRVRKAPTASILYVGETSDIPWANGDYITVVNDFSPWQRHLYIDPSTKEVFMDRDVAYTDQHEDFDPIPIMGGHHVAKLTGADVDIFPDGSNSWVIDDGISGYSWTAPGASATASMTSATPTITYDTEGFYRISLTVTATSGKNFTGYRYVWIYSDTDPGKTISVAELNSTGGIKDSGGWTFEVTAYAEANITSIRPMSGAIVFAEDIYDTGVSIGPWAGEENTVVFGWIDGETIVWDAVAGTVTFAAGGPSYWLGKMSGFPTGVEDTDLPEGGVPPSWTAISDLGFNKGLFHFFHWRSTITMLADVILYDDTAQFAALESPTGTLWEQLVSISEPIFAAPLSDRTGRIFVEIDLQVLEEDDRVGYPVVHDILSQDLRERVEIFYEPARKVGLLDVSGTAYINGSATPLCFKAPGKAISREGAVTRRDRLAFINVNSALITISHYLGWLNNHYPLINVKFASNHRMFDIAPLQFGTLAVVAADTPRGITFDKRMIPRAVRFQYSETNGVLLTDVEFEGESVPENAIQVTCPEFPLIGLNLEIPGLPAWPIGPPTSGGEYDQAIAATAPLSITTFTEGGSDTGYVSHQTSNPPYFFQGGVTFQTTATGSKLKTTVTGIYRVLISFNIWIDPCTPGANNFYNNPDVPIYITAQLEKYNSNDFLHSIIPLGDSSAAPAYTYTLDTGAAFRTNVLSITGINTQKYIGLTAGQYLKLKVTRSTPFYGEGRMFSGSWGMYRLGGGIPSLPSGFVANLNHYYDHPSSVVTVIDSIPYSDAITNDSGQIKFNNSGIYLVKTAGAQTSYLDAQLSAARASAAQELCSAVTNPANRKYNIFPDYRWWNGSNGFEHATRTEPPAGSSFHSSDAGRLRTAFASTYLAKAGSGGDTHSLYVGNRLYYYVDQNSKSTPGGGFATDHQHTGTVSAIKIGNL